MHTLVTFEEAEGKTFKSYRYGSAGDAIVVFDDQTFAYIKAYGGWEGSAPDLEESAHFDWLEFGDQRIVEAGIATQGELDRMRQERSRRYAERSREDERKMYERLKAKFEKAG